MECSIFNWIEHIIPFIVSGCAIFGFDILLFCFNMRNVARWYKLHAFANFLVCVTGFYDFISVLWDPISETAATSLVPANIVFALHLYHMIMFVNLSTIDWIHHIVMMSLLQISYICPDTMFTNYILFMTSGLPGGIDYLLLIAVKSGYILKLREKELNAYINVWLRGPGIVIGAYIIFLRWRYNIIPYGGFWILLVVAGLIWNGQYFTKRVVYNWAQKNIDK